MLAGTLVWLGCCGLEPTARADDGFELANSAAQHLRVLADGGADWCGPGLQLRMVLDPDSPALRDPAQQDAMLNRLGALISRSCPQAVWAQIAVQSGGKLLATRSLDKAKGWVLPVADAAKPNAAPSPVSPTIAAAPPTQPAATTGPTARPVPPETRLAMYAFKPDSQRAVNQILTDQHKNTQQSPAARQAMDRAWADGLDRPPSQPAAGSPPDPLADQLSAALKSGPPNPSLMPSLADVYNKLTGPKDPQRAALVALLTKAGRPIPPQNELDEHLKAASDVRANRQSPSQHVTVPGQGGNIRVDHSPTGGGTAVSVIQNGPDGQPTRETFSGQEVATPTADGSAIETPVQSNPPREMTQAQSDAALASIGGIWIDQDGNTWTLSDPGKGASMTATETYKSGHTVAYQSNWTLGLLDGSHTVNDVADMDDGLPMDVRQQLAGQFHPPFAIKLEYLPDSNTLRGQWISGTVTYSGMSHAVRVVDDPTWDKALVLTRNPWKLASGAGDKEAP